MSNKTNGTITLKSFAELASAFDVSANAGATAGQLSPDNSQPLAMPGLDNSERSLSDVVAQLAAIGSDLEALARDDARAREQATVDLAQYDAILADRQDADHALTEARRLRELAEQLVIDAFDDITRAQVSHHLATARAAE